MDFSDKKPAAGLASRRKSSPKHVCWWERSEKPVPKKTRKTRRQMTKNLIQNFQKLNSRSILKVPLQVMKVKDDLNFENSANSALCLLNSTFQTLRESFLEIMSKTKKTNLLYLFDEFNEIYAKKNEFTPIEIELVRVSRKLQILSSFLLEKICGMSNETVDCDDEQEEVRERLISRIETASLKLVENRNKLPVDVFDEESDLI